MAFGISEQTIEEIKARTDLADLIAGYGIPVKRAGGSYKACCPFHHEKTPSFNIQPSKGFYHCFGCGESGDVIKFVMKYEGRKGRHRKILDLCRHRLYSRKAGQPHAHHRARLRSSLH